MFVIMFKRSEHILFSGLSLLLFVGAFAWLWYIKDMNGVPWDEPWQQKLGVKSWDFAIGKNDDLLGIQNRYHGGSFETLAEGISRAYGAHGFAAKMKVRRVIMVLFFMLGAVCLYFAAKQLSQRKWAGAAALAVLFFTPRIMAQASYNSKDLALLSAGSFFLWMSLAFWNTGKWRFVWLSGIAAGLMISLRIPAVYVLMLWPAVPVFLYFQSKLSVKKMLGCIGLFVPISVLAMYAFWPVLWGSPVERFAEAWSFMSKFPWEDPVLFAGEFTTGDRLPGYYLPVWMAITIPPLWMLLGLLSSAVAFFQLIKKDTQLFRFLFLFGYVVVPILAVWLLKSIVYDEWRHLFFVYPGIILLGIYVLDFLFSRFEKPWFKWALILLFLAQLLEAGLWSYQNKAYTYLYFSPPVRNVVCGRFEQDYWGLSYQDGNAYLLSLYGGEPLKICYVHYPGYYNYWNLRDEEKAKLKLVSYDEAQYVVTSHRYEIKKPDYGDLVFTRKVNGCSILSVFKRF